MSEKQGTLTVHVLGTTKPVLGTTKQGVPVTLRDAEVKIYECAEAAESKRRSQPRGECIHKKMTGANGSCVVELSEREYYAAATYTGEGETPFPDKIYVCAGGSVDVTINIPTDIKVYTSQTHCEADYTEADLCHFTYKIPT